MEDRPTPDPTILTTEQLLREIARLERLMESQVGGLRDLIEEKFVSVGTQFTLIERQRVEQKQDTKAAVDAALAAAKEAVKEQKDASDRSITKTETATGEQLKQQGVTSSTAIAGITSMIGDLKDRVGTLESLRVGGKENTAAVYALVGLLVATAVLGFGALTFLGR